MAVKMNLRIITKNHAADPEIGLLAKSISKCNGYATAMPTALESKWFKNGLCKASVKFNFIFYFTLSFKVDIEKLFYNSSLNHSSNFGLFKNWLIIDKIELVTVIIN